MYQYTVVATFGVLLMVSSPALASTWYVNGAGGHNGQDCKTRATACATISHVVSLAASGDTIVIAPATYHDHLSITFDLTLAGAKAATTIIAGGSRSNVISVASGASLTLSNLTIEKGLGYTGGGGVDNSGNLTVSNSNFYLNTALSGGAILNTGVAVISDTNFSGNSPLFSGHSANCGAIDNQSTMTISTSTFYNNYDQNNFTSGGAICNGGALTVTASTFDNNSAGGNNGGYGGAIYTYAGTLVVTNSTFSANAATNSGGAIYSAGGTVQISNSTFGNNPETIGGGGALGNAGGAFTVQNSILDNAANGGNCGGAITSAGYNLSGDASCQFSGPGDLNGVNPLLRPLAGNGGPTQTMALSRHSPALDAGNPAGCRDFAGTLLTTDQRGLPRPGVGETTGCDLGAFESQTY